MDKLAALVFDIDTVMKIELPGFNVSRHTIARSIKGRACYCVLGHFGALRIENFVRAVAKVHEIAGHQRLLL
jgi:hypothetical protein